MPPHSRHHNSTFALVIISKIVDRVIFVCFCVCEAKLHIPYVRVCVSICFNFTTTYIVPTCDTPIKPTFLYDELYRLARHQMAHAATLDSTSAAVKIIYV